MEHRLKESDAACFELEIKISELQQAFSEKINEKTQENKGLIRQFLIREKQLILAQNKSSFVTQFSNARAKSYETFSKEKTTYHRLLLTVSFDHLSLLHFL